jgi:hypothetical protein
MGYTAFGGSALGTTIEGSEITNATIEDVDIGAVKWRLVATTTLAAAAQAIDFSGLDEDTDGMYIIVADLVCAGGVGECPIYLNADYTATNYYRGLAVFDNAGVSDARANSSAFASPTGDDTHIVCYVGRNADAYGRWMSPLSLSELGATIRGIHLFGSTKAAITNITAIRLDSGVASGFEIGTKIDIYKIA